MKILIRLALAATLGASLAASLAASAISHTYLYVHGYHHIPTIGTAFLIQASMSFALALLIVAGGPAWLRWAAAVVAGGSLAAFVLSRIVGLLGFSERGWEPSPHAAISVTAEVLTVLLWAVSNWLRCRRSSFRSQSGCRTGRSDASEMERCRY